SLSGMTIQFLYGDDQRQRMADAARAIPCRWEKDGGSTYFYLTGHLHGLKLALMAYRDEVCTRVVTGTELQEVEEEVQPAVTRTVVKPVEIVEWQCSPLLAPPEVTR